MKRTIPLMIAAVVGFVLIFSSFIPIAQGWGEDAMAWFNILAAMAFILGGGNLLKMHLKKVSDSASGWGYSLVLIVVFFLTLYVGLFKVGVHPSANYPGYSWSGDYQGEGSVMWWIYEYVVNPLVSMMYAMLAFYIASAAFRAFRAKNTEAIVLLVTAFIVLLGRTYAGVILTKWGTQWVPADSTNWFYQMIYHLRLDRLTSIIMNIFNLAGNRAIMIGIALGIVSTSLKVLLGVDRSYLGSEEG